MSMENSNDTIGNRTRAVAQCLNQLRHRVPHICFGGRGNEANCAPLRHSISGAICMLNTKPFKCNSSVSHVYSRRRSRHLRRKEKGETLASIYSSSPEMSLIS